MKCLIASLADFERLGHLEYYTLAGADLAARQAIRPLLGLLKKAYGSEFDLKQFEWLLKPIEPDLGRQQIILEQLEKNINTAQTSSLGRLFDAVAAMLGIGGCNNFDAQLPMALESAADNRIRQCYHFELIEAANKPFQLEIRTLMEGIIEDIRKRKSTGVIAAKFHNTIASALSKMAEMARQKTGLETVAISGGVFCNSLLANRLVRLLKKNGFRVLFNRIVPPNDGGISLGQAAIASLVNRRLLFKGQR